MKIDPRGGSVQFPVAGGNESLIDFIGPANGCPAPVSLEPHAMAVRVNLTTAFPAAATGAVSGMLGALGLRTEKCQMLKAAIPTLPARKKHLFGNVLQGFGEKVPKRSFLKSGAEIPVYARKQRVMAEKGAVNLSVYAKQHFLPG